MAVDVESILKPLDLSHDTLRELTQRFAAVYTHLALNSPDQFLATPVKLPSGNETGSFLAIDVGGTNLRVCFIELLGSKNGSGENLLRKHERSWPIEEHLKSDHADDLFKWIGGCIVDVVNQKMTTDSQSIGKLLVGVTFSFPMSQKAIGEATLMAMGKGFTLPSNLDLRALVLDGYRFWQEQENSKLPEMDIIAITNDTVATLASSVYSAKAIPGGRVAMGLIMGTGTNATIPLKIKDLHQTKTAPLTLPGNNNNENTAIVVNTEWTINGSAGPLRELGIINKWDEQLDSECEVPGFQPFEYMTSGRYLGELARLIIFDIFVNVMHASPADLPQPLCQRNALSTLFLSSVVAPSSSSEELLQHLRQHLHSRNPERWEWTHEQAEILRMTARKLQQRSSRLVASSVTGLLLCAHELDTGSKKHNGTVSEVQHAEELLVAYTGGVIAKYPHYLQDCQETIDRLFEDIAHTPHVKGVRLHAAHDGGVIGAGVIAGTVHSLRN